MLRREFMASVLSLGMPAIVRSQVIEFESSGLKYRTLTKRGVTIMFAPLPAQVRGYAAVQVAVSNGSQDRVTISPLNFWYRFADGQLVQAGSAEAVVGELIERGSRGDVIKLVTAYEQGLYGIVRFRSTNGYESRRQAALAEVTNTRLKAAAAASAIAFTEEQLQPGASTDGVVFIPTQGRTLDRGWLIVKAVNEVFDFHLEEHLLPNKELQTRDSPPSGN